VVQQVVGHAFAPPGATPEGTVDEKHPDVVLAVAPTAAPGATTGVWGASNIGCVKVRRTGDRHNKQHQLVLTFRLTILTLAHSSVV
jgi:hypothetical protein